MQKIISYGESLIRFDVAPDNQVHMMPTGTSLNFLTSLSRLGDFDLNIVSALTNKKDSQIFLNHLKQNNINDLSYQAKNNPLGSYTLFRMASIYSWEVIYNRASTAWKEYAESDAKILNNIKTGDLVHFDGISLYSSNASQKKTIEEISLAKKQGAKIMFDFNLRKTLTSSKDHLMSIFKEIIKKVDYLNISYYDLKSLLKIDKINQEKWKKLLNLFPNIKCVFGTKKENIDDETLGISGFIFKDNLFRETQVMKYKPQELIGQGDAFGAHIIYQELSNKEINLEKSLMWSIYKTKFIGDANVQSKQEFANYIKKINIIR